MFSTNYLFKGRDWESVKSKYNKIHQLFANHYLNSPEGLILEEYPKSQSLEMITRDIIVAKLISIRKITRKRWIKEKKEVVVGET